MDNHINSKLAHLPEQQIIDLRSRYYAGEPIKDLLREFNIECRTNQLHKLLPEEEAPDQPCPYCDITMFKEVPSRTTMASRYRQDVIYCQTCGHKLNSSCRCRNCIETKAEQLRNFREVRLVGIANFCLQMQPASPKRLLVSQLSLREAVSILTLARASTFLDNHLDAELTIESVDLATIPFTPSGILDDQLLGELMGAGLIYPSANSDDKAFDLEGGIVTGFRPSQVRWGFSFVEPRALIAEIERCSGDGSLWPDHWGSDIRNLWSEISLAECKEFYRYVASERGLPPSGATSTEVMLKNLLKDYSVAQCYHVIYAGAQKTADFMVKNHHTKIHAANYMIGACQRWIDRARVEDWEVSGFKRNYNLPRSALSHVFFDLFLKIGEYGFSSVIIRFA